MLKGKRGNHRPVDKVGEVAHNKKRQFKGNLAEQDVARSETEKPKPEQQTLVDAKAQAEPVVQDRFIAVNFVKPHAERDKNGKAHVGLEFSLELTEQHRLQGVLPKRVIEVWDGMVSLGVDKISVDGVPAQDIEVALSPRAMEKSSGLAIKFGEITNANISVVEAKGDGKAKDITRLQFRVKCELDTTTWRFAGVHFLHQLWLRMNQAQGSLLEQESEAA